MQVVRVPHAGSRQLGVVARRLVGCNPVSLYSINSSAAGLNGVSECPIIGGAPVGCPTESSTCLEVGTCRVFHDFVLFRPISP